MKALNIDAIEGMLTRGEPVSSSDCLLLIKEVRQLRRSLDETEKAAYEIRSKNEELVFRIKALADVEPSNEPEPWFGQHIREAILSIKELFGRGKI